MNKVFLVGRLTRDPEIRYTQGNTAVATFSLAVDRRLSKDKKAEFSDAGRATADFPRVTVWGRSAETCTKYLHKGSQCVVEGRLQTGSYEDRESGKRVYTTDVVAENVEFLSSGKDKDKAGSEADVRSDDEWFGDDFTEIQDDGRMPF